MGGAVLEVERKYDVPERASMPTLVGVVPGAVVDPVTVRELVATYLDTPDLRLRATSTTLRHRSGDDDAGWHLKLPARDGRLEVRVDGDLPPGAPPDVPAELRALVRAVARTAPLEPVAELRTRRTVHALRDDAGRLLVEVVDDEVSAVLLADGSVERWREWEAELASADAGGDALLDAVERALLAAGARPSRSASKVGRVLERHPRAQAAPWWRPPAQEGRGGTAGDVVRAHLAGQVAELTRLDPRVRRDEDDAVHRMRVTTRRLRSALTTFRPLLDRSRTDPVRAELRWLAAVLGGARDAEVVHARVRALLAAEPPELVLGPVVQTADDLLGRRYRLQHEEVVRTLDGDRYLALLDALDGLVETPPWRPRAHRSAGDVLPRLVGRAYDRLDAGLARARPLSGPEQEEALHTARKQAKQVRYACEAVAPVFPRARQLAKAVTALQEALGDQQDSVVVREVLRELGAMSSRAGRNGFTFGRLHALEQLRGSPGADGTGWQELWQRAGRRRLHRWTR